MDRPSTSCDLISTVANVQAKTSEFEIKTLKGLEQIKTQVNYNTSLLLQIIKKVDVQQTVDAEDNDDNELPVLPIKTMLQLEGVENALKVDTIKNRLSKTTLAMFDIFETQLVLQFTPMVTIVPIMKTVWNSQDQISTYPTTALKDKAMVIAPVVTVVLRSDVCYFTNPVRQTAADVFSNRTNNYHKMT
ncbi:Hypothetical predicted protein [Mytilus galloprovincialis]|uniref:Uncharacterized protein n=1 Tax=Mytilus galloprovincialis TaxID=29158 RepID=A0A8B6FJP9_MYTGA|nr:Hypothetical predicted protein [Mytilus galloprovincialis]